MREPSRRVTRRQFLEIATITAGALAVAPARSLRAQQQVRRETADLITGPFYPRIKPRDSDVDLTWIRGHRERAAGQIVRLSGRVMNVRGEPVPHAHIELWQADLHGRYAHPSDPNTVTARDPHFQGYGVLRTDRDGRYVFTTIKPGPYPTARGDMRAPHIHFQVDGTTDRKVTQLFFPDEALNAQDRHLQSVRRPETLIATVAPMLPGESVLTAVWDIVLTTG